jgi:hypothetical protein
MKRCNLALCGFVFLMMLTSCVTVGGISDEERASQPTIFAKVLKEPNPSLLGFWRRETPDGLNKPWVFQYYLTKVGDKYAVYYFYDSHKKNMHKGWADFTINGDIMTSGVDGVTIFVKEGKVCMQIPGRSTVYDMQRLD